MGNITSKATEHGGYAYGYDNIYQLTESTAPAPSPQELFTYDPSGNRTLDNSAPAGLTFGATQFYYNSRNRLETATLPDGRTATYIYDPFGRRIKKTILPPPPVGGGTGEGETTYYAYSDEGLIGEYNQNGTLIKAYGWRPDTIWGTAPVLMVENGNYYFYHNDHLGTPQRMSDINGAAVWSAKYTAFGNAVIQTATVTNNLRFPGQYYDEETGLHYNWNRYYDPRTGRYTQEDPIGFGGGDKNFYRYADSVGKPLTETNLYAYTGNSPVNYIDPLGLFPSPSQILNDTISYWGEFFGAAGDFRRNFNDMNATKRGGGDKYFHCKANCEAARRGPAGEDAACLLSNAKEFKDVYWTGHPKSDSAEDQAANQYGRNGGSNTKLPCAIVCQPYRPASLPPGY